jgi:MFS family permease
MALGETGDVGRRLGMFMSIVGLGALVGPPISGAINAATGGSEIVGYFAGKYRCVFLMDMIHCFFFRQHGPCRRWSHVCH